MHLKEFNTCLWKQCTGIFNPRRSERFFPALKSSTRPQRPRSFWLAPKLASSGRTWLSLRVQSFRFVFSVNQICEIWRKFHESRPSGAGPAQRAGFLVPSKWSTASGEVRLEFLVQYYVYVIEYRLNCGYSSWHCSSKVKGGIEMHQIGEPVEV